MRGKILLIISLIYVFQMGAPVANAQTLLDIINADGAERKIELGTLGKITFSGTNMVFNFLNGSNESITISSVQKMFFTKSTKVSFVNANDKISIYPNPVTSFIFLKNAPAGDLNITVFSLSGTMALKLLVPSASDQIDVSSLPKGFYLLKVNDQVFKFSKL